MKPGILMAETVVVLPPDERTEQVIQRSDRPPPGDLARHLEPLGVLVEHRIDDVDKGLVAGEEAVAAGEQVALQPALALVLAEHFHHAAVGGHVIVDGRIPAVEQRSVTSNTALQRLEAVSSGLKTRKLLLSQLSFITSRMKLPWMRQASASTAPGLGHVHGVVFEIGQPQVAHQHAAVGVRVRAHAARRPWGPTRPVPA